MHLSRHSTISNQEKKWTQPLELHIRSTESLFIFFFTRTSKVSPTSAFYINTMFLGVVWFAQTTTKSYLGIYQMHSYWTETYLDDEMCGKLQ